MPGDTKDVVTGFEGKMNFDEIKKYWEDRADGDSSAQSTTQDFYLREIEYSVLTKRIQKYTPDRVADVGCGDGRTTVRLAKNLQLPNVIGYDYSSSMIKNARNYLSSEGLTNVKFERLDICEELNRTFNLVYTTRCLINLPSWELQKLAIRNIHQSLVAGGIYLMIENFTEGHENFNQVRKIFDLPEIPIRDHNFFFRRNQLLDFVDGMFEVEEEVNVSSTYYLMSRIVYSKICAETGKVPDYFDDHHRFSADLPFAGEYGPVRLVSLKKPY